MIRPRVRAVFCLLASAAIPLPAGGQQVADTAFRPPLPAPAYPRGAGPVLRIDEAHHNFHTLEGRYRPFAELAARDGYRVGAHAERFSAASLAGVDVLVVANAVGEGEDWARPIEPAFTADEVAAVVRWVEGGGGLLLLVDHMPFPGAAAPLMRALGLRPRDGFVFRDEDLSAVLVFRRSDGTLADHPITRGRDASERVDSVATFTGHAFLRGEPGADALLRLPGGTFSLEPDTAWRFHRETPRTDTEGWLQGAAFRRGEGRVVVLGEAAMFSAQLAGELRRPMGMNAPVASGNPTLLLNTLHWLSGLLPEASPRVGPPSGSLVVVGGALRDTAVVRRFLELAGGPDAPIVVIPTAAGVERAEEARGSLAVLERGGATNLTLLHTNDPEVADTDAFVAPIERASGVWFPGGRQWRIADAYLGTRTEEALWGVLERGGVIGGTSAGATIQGSYLARGDTRTNTVMMGDHEEGFGFLRGVAIDQHLLRRNRHFDLFEIVDARPELLGIGLDENTALVVRGDWGEVIGESYVAVYDPARRGERVPFYLLSAGDVLDLAARRPFARTRSGLLPLSVR